MSAAYYIDPGILCRSSDTNATSLEAQQAQYKSTLASQYIASRLLRKPCVEYVFVEKSNGIFHVWTIVDTAQESQYDEIYSEEAAIIRDLRPSEFDFRVITRRSRPLREVITLSCQGWRKNISE